ncbi:heptahelical transmembrane protein 1-like [Nicotiana tomentosiformis]|uniref:heptahelical transmembrane protein 1-like n=1 Tax=Nicotiana tomentosiformis TaxID=4098 RepID=UPI00051C75C3|nr:heptahelical transmembrane protein 1-like [Nicotiana tomentosiformis]
MIKSSKGSVWKRKNKENMMNEEKDEKLITNSSKKMKKNINGKSKGENENYPLLCYHELPKYMKDNEFILNYYRANWPIKEAFLSIFRWHNETLNVWTHLLGFILFVGLTIVNVVEVPQLADFMTMFIWNFPTSGDANVSNNSKEFFQGSGRLIDLKQDQNLQLDIMSTQSVQSETTWPFYVFLAGSMFCLLSSSICHLFSCHSHKLNILLLRMDYVGITVMIITSFFPPIYYIFQCSQHWQIVYLSGITIMGICTIITLLSPVFSTHKYRSFRAVLFMSMGFFGLIPAIHAVILNWDEPERNVTLAYESAMALSYLIGTMFYVTRIPERWRPGFFDLAGHSHQIFHVFVILGALAHYGAAQIFLEYRSRLGCDKP